MIRFLKSLFLRRRPIVVQTYKVERSDAQKLRDKLRAQLARELGKPWGLR